MAIALFTSRKDFSHSWVGNPLLNRLGLHRARMCAAECCAGIRRAQRKQRYQNLAATLNKDGIIVVENFLPQKTFIQLREAVVNSLEVAAQTTPAKTGNVVGFGEKQSYSWGFDRYDGGTLNRFITIHCGAMPGCCEFVEDPRLAQLSRAVCGMAPSRRQAWIYLTLNGDQQRMPDLQRVLHRDTFFSSMKYWYFIEPVTETDGPLVYVPGSHRLTRARLRWEQRMAEAACQARYDRNAGALTSQQMDLLSGSFRIAEQVVLDMGYPAPRAYPVPANTLVMADTLGFHRRGDALPETWRLAIYGNKRPGIPFSLLAR